MKYIRKRYVNWMKKQIGTHFIKVLTGLRRAGKSTLLELFYDYLRDNKGVSEKNILFIDMESLKFQHIRDHIQLNNSIQDQFQGIEGPRFLFIDEIQEIEGWEKTVASLHKQSFCDIYITGSNAHLLSSDLATYLAGRFVRIEIYTLSYKEFIEIQGKENHSNEMFQKYLTFGGFPGVTILNTDEETRFKILDDLYSSIILKDIVARYQIRNTSFLENLTEFFFDNIGNPVTAKSISDYMKSQKVSVSPDSVQLYIGYLCACYAVHKIKRFDIKGKRLLEINEKHYIGDIGLRHALLGYRAGDISQILENIVFLELKRRGYSVSIGKINDLEIDFIAEKPQKRVYIQVSYLLSTQKTREREFAPLKAVRDSFPKYVLSMDPIPQNEEGINHLHIPDFLIQEGNTGI